MALPRITCEPRNANHKDQKWFRGYIKRKRKAVLKKLNKAHEQADEKTIARCVRQLQDLLSGIGTVLEHTEPPAIPKPLTKDDGLKPITKFVITAGFLFQYYTDIVAKTDNESVHYVSGAVVKDTAYLNHIVGFKLTTQNAVRAIADANDQALALHDLDEKGMPFLSYFHSHPGHGTESNHPSSTDVAYQKRLEAMGYTSMIAAIFGRGRNGECYVRFFPDWKQFDIEIQGKGVTRVSKNSYQIGPYDCSRSSKRTIISPNQYVAR